VFWIGSIFCSISENKTFLIKAQIEMAFSMAIDKKERRIIGRALRSHRELATSYAIDYFQIGDKRYSPLDLADLIDNGDRRVNEALANASAESRRDLAKMMAHKLTRLKTVSYHKIERGYETGGISGWLSALREQIGVGDFEFNDRRRTHLSGFSNHFDGERCEYYERTIGGKYLDNLVAKLGVKKAWESRY